jgi:hypothetical protein
MSDKSQERIALEQRADELGVKYRSNTTDEKLASDVKEAEAAPKTTETSTKAHKDMSRAERKKAASEMVRIRVTCMNPLKKEWDGEIFTAGNSAVGTFRKMVPFNEEWHVPRIILNMLKQRKCQVFTNKRNPKTGITYREGKLIPEFAIEELPPLTKEELKDLAQRQAMANGTAEA